MTEAGFAFPLGLLGLLAVLPLAGAWAYATMRTRQADRAYGGGAALRVGRSRGRTLVRRALLLAAIVFASLAFARPQWGTAETPVQRQGIDVVIALDISRSMQAADVAPSRAKAAAAGLSEMLRHLGGDRVGLVTFAGTAFARSPLTLDTDAIADLVTRAQRENSLVGPGTDIGAAVTTALGLLEIPDRAGTRAIVLISDGEDLATTLGEAVTRAKQQGVRIYTIAAGTEAGALVPAGEGARGAGEVTSRADRATLARIASETGATTRDVSSLPGLAVELSRLQQTELDRDRQEVPIERFQWPLGIALVLLVAQTLVAEGATSGRQPNAPGAARAHAVALAAFAMLLGSCMSGTAAYRKVREANAEYASSRYQRALEGYAAAKQMSPDDPIIDYDIGNTLHMLERYDDATAASKAAATKTRDGALYARATYAVASDAFRQGKLTDARDGFVAVLQRDPHDGDARHNLEVVLRAMRREAERQQQQGDQGNRPPGGTPQPGAPQPGPGQAPNQPGAQPGNPQPGAQPGRGRPGGAAPSGAPATDADAERAAQEALRDALAGLPAEELTAEEALRILDAARAASEASTLQRSGGAAPNPNDR